MLRQAKERFYENNGVGLEAAAEACRSVAGAGADRGKKGVVYFITSDKVIQAVMTASAFAVIASGLETVGLVIRALTGIPLAPIELMLMIGVFHVALWADNHTEEWRAFVEATTGQEAAEND